MIAARRTRAQLLPGLLLGLYGAAIALTPDLTWRALLTLPLLAIPFGWWILGDSYRWLIAFFLSSWLLPPLPIALGNSGPHMAILFAAAGLWIGSLYLANQHFELDSVLAWLLGLFGALLISLPMAFLYSGPEIAAASFARVILFGISVYVYLFVRNGPAFNSRLFIRFLFCAAVASAIFACVDFYFQFPAPAGYGAQFIWLDTGVFRRAQGLFYEASTLGNFCAFFLVMIGAALVSRPEDRPLPIWILLGGGAVLATALVLSYSRGSLLNVLVAFTVLAWLQRKRIRWQRILPALAISAGVGAAALFALFPTFLWAYGLRVWGSAEYFFESPNGVLSGRVHSWALLTDFLQSQPWHAILGVGYKTLPYSDFIGTTAIADNAYFSALIETGIAGLVALIGLNIATLIASYRAARSTDPFRCFAGVWMLCFWSGQMVQMFSGDLLTYWRVVPAYFCVLALANRPAGFLR